MTIGEVIRRYRNEHQLSQRRFVEKCGDITNGYISMLENNKNPTTGKPPKLTVEKAKCIAHGMGISYHELLGMVDDMPIDISSALPKGHSIPILGNIPAGIPLEAIEDIEGWEELSPSMFKGAKEYFGLAVKGDSMSPEYRSGDVLILQMVDSCETGDDCAVMVGSSDATFKRVRRTEKGITLQPLNPAYDPVFYTNDEIAELPVRIIGVVVEVRRKIKK